MRLLVLVAVLGLAAASVLNDDVHIATFIGKESLVNVDIKVKELCIMKLLNHILQPTVYEDIRAVAREWVIEDNLDKYLRADVVRTFIDTYKMGMLPRGEVFVHTNDMQLEEAVKVFKLLYVAKDFDVFVRTCCWLRQRINGGMFVYALTVAVFHRTDCKGIMLPAPYEIYPYFSVDSNIIQKSLMMKMTKAVTDPAVMDYQDIKMTDKKHVVIDWRKGLRHAMTKDDRLSYFTEDIDLNTFAFYAHMNFPYWMTDDIYNLKKMRYGEVLSYISLQLLARHKLERLSHKMCDVKPIMWHEPLKTGYWPKILLHTGEHMPVRSNNMVVLTDSNVNIKRMLDDVERTLRDGVLTGKIELRDGTTISLKKEEDFENFARLVMSDMQWGHDDAKRIHLYELMSKMLTYNLYNVDKYSYLPTALDTYITCLRDPVFWKLLKRITDTLLLYKDMRPMYTREVFDFSGVKIDRISTDKLLTFMDDHDIDITNAVYLDEDEMKKMRPDMTFAARVRRLNVHKFKVDIDVTSDKSVESVVRIFIGPKYDCMGRLLSVNDKRLDMVEIDSFIYKLQTGKNTIVRNSFEMHGVIEERPWTRRILDRTVGTTGTMFKNVDVESWWYKSRIGFPHRLLLPLGYLGGMPLQMFVIITPVKTGMVLPTIDMNFMKDSKICYFSSCFDTMPLGFPFDRRIDITEFFTHNMKFLDIMVYRQDMDLANKSKDVDFSDMVMKWDDLTYLHHDKLVRWSYKDVMMSSKDRMMRM